VEESRGIVTRKCGAVSGERRGGAGLFKKESKLGVEWICLRNRYEEKSSEIEQMRGSQAVDQSWRLSLVRPGSLWDVVEAKLTTAN
jgi:hypothetical protein